ncbi:MAG: UPF0179 family protein [Candidatus Methanoplasma sp.]|jgi:uncharacterized protein (UPF0179 family)|nr:UPF0179 family protein [Candidatus Methanoplasma sp.]
MALISLIGESQAKVGNRFYFLGPQPECKDCKLKGVCFNLDQGSQYEIIEIRKQVHDCASNEDLVRAVAVVKVSTDATVPKKQAIDGSIITFKTVDCGQLGCEHYRICHPVGIEDGKKYSIVETGEDVVCPVGKKIVFAKII